MGTIKLLTLLDRYGCAADSESVLKEDGEIGKNLSTGKTKYETFLKIAKHELR